MVTAFNAYRLPAGLTRRNVWGWAAQRGVPKSEFDEGDDAHKILKLGWHASYSDILRPAATGAFKLVGGTAAVHWVRRWTSSGVKSRGIGMPATG